jgi:hypothetical protein
MVSALAAVTGLDSAIRDNRRLLEDTAVQLSGYKPEAVLKRYGPDSEWYKLDWRGQKGEMPTLKAIKETIGKAALGAAPSINGRHPSAPALTKTERAAMEYARMKADIQRRNQ